MSWGTGFLDGIVWAFAGFPSLSMRGLEETSIWSVYWADGVLTAVSEVLGFPSRTIIYLFTTYIQLTIYIDGFNALNSIKN